jgi:2'-5' RNA ligase
MSSGPCGEAPISCFALVTYVPEPLGSFLDDLRRELAPGCLPRAHVTILPPRPLAAPTGDVIAELAGKTSELEAFEIEAGAVGTFEQTSVIYLGLAAGRRELQRIHDRLNTGLLEFCEPFPYWPHVTLAQDLTSAQVAPIRALAERRWADFRGSRSIPVETLSFVQSAENGRWLDLSHLSLRPVPLAR